MDEFQTPLPDNTLADSCDRLHRTRWPEAESVDRWSQDVPLACGQPQLFVKDVRAFFRLLR